jgi:hypothetical protein
MLVCCVSVVACGETHRPEATVASTHHIRKVFRGRLSSTRLALKTLVMLANLMGAYRDTW